MSIAQHHALLAQIAELRQSLAALQRQIDELSSTVAPLVAAQADPVRYSRKDESRRARL